MVGNRIQANEEPVLFQVIRATKPSYRVNLGIVRKDENALWSLVPHDVSIILYLLDQEIETVRARGASFLQSGIEDVVFCNLQFANGPMAQI